MIKAQKLKGDVYTVDYKDLESYIKTELGPAIKITDVPNDTDWYCDATKHLNDDKFLDARALIYNKNPCVEGYEICSVMQFLVMQNLLPPAHYIIRVCW